MGSCSLYVVTQRIAGAAALCSTWLVTLLLLYHVFVTRVADTGMCHIISQNVTIDVRLRSFDSDLHITTQLCVTADVLFLKDRTVYPLVQRPVGLATWRHMTTAAADVYYGNVDVLLRIADGDAGDGAPPQSHFEAHKPRAMAALQPCTLLDNSVALDVGDDVIGWYHLPLVILSALFQLYAFHHTLRFCCAGVA